MSDKIMYKKCISCNIEFQYPVNRGKTWVKSKERIPTVVVDGFCSDCCDEKAEEATNTMDKILEKHPDIKKAFDEYVYCKGLSSSATLLD